MLFLQLESNLEFSQYTLDVSSFISYLLTAVYFKLHLESIENEQLTKTKCL